MISTIRILLKHSPYHNKNLQRSDQTEDNLGSLKNKSTLPKYLKELKYSLQIYKLLFSKKLINFKVGIPLSHRWPN